MVVILSWGQPSRRDSGLGVDFPALKRRAIFGLPLRGAEKQRDRWVAQTAQYPG